MRTLSVPPKSGEVIVAGTGHRPPKIGGYKIPNSTYTAIADWVRKQLREIQPECVISGMAIGFDQILADQALDMGIPLVAAVPFKGQERKWPSRVQNEYNEILNYAHEIVYVSPQGYSSRKMQIRNEWMVDRCTHLLACWDGSSGGTKNCWDYAFKQMKQRTIHHARYIP